MPENSLHDDSAGYLPAPPVALRRCLLPRITRSVFCDLAVWMVGLGLLTGIVFPFFVLLLAVPARIALQPVFMIACVSAGVGVGGLNFVLARNVVGQRIRNLSLRMRGLTNEVRDSALGDQADGALGEHGLSDFHPLPVDSNDELGESAAAFNMLLVELARSRAAEAAARDAAEQRSRTDMLTSLYNRRHMWELLVAELERSRRENAAAGILLADVDHFKSINDRFGHRAGDAVLIEVARRLRAAARRYDVIARWGGEEFCVLAPGVDTEQDLLALSERLRRAVASEPFALRDGASLPVSISIGGVRAADPDRTVEDQLEVADQALYAAKTAGRNCSRLARTSAALTTRQR
jgi:diguanylate cyclase (GGDEF)-like protein